MGKRRTGDSFLNDTINNYKSKRLFTSFTTADRVVSGDPFYLKRNVYHKNCFAYVTIGNAEGIDSFGSLLKKLRNLLSEKLKNSVALNCRGFFFEEKGHVRVGVGYFDLAS